MNKIYFKHGTMFSGKSLNLISTVKTYEHNGYNVLILKPSKDTRDKQVIKSRMSNEVLECVTFTDKDDLYILVTRLINDKMTKYDVIFIDEVQFCSEKHIEQLHYVSKYAPIICYGLKTSYTGDIFPSIAKLIPLAEDIQEIKTVCAMCNKKATHNLLLRNNVPVYEGDQVNIEGEDIQEQYKAVCRMHFYGPRIAEEEQLDIKW